MSLSSSADDLSFPQRRPMTLAPYLVGVAFAAVALAQQSKLAAWLRGFLSVPRERTVFDPIRRRLDAGWSLTQLREAILGRHKTVLLARYGAPKSAALHNVILAGASDQPAAALRADTWYYLLDPAARTLMSIRFQGSVASEVEFFDAP